MNGTLDEERAVDIVYPNFSKAFSTVSHKVLTEKLMKYRLDKRMVRWVENWLNWQTQRVLISGTMSSWRPVTSCVPQESILFNLFINDLDDVRECTLSMFAGDTKLGEAVNVPNGFAAIQWTSTGISWSSTKGNTMHRSFRPPALPKPWHLHPIP